MIMKTFSAGAALLCAAALPPCPARGAVTLPVPVAPSAFADTESETNVAVPPLGNLHRVEVSLDFSATPSNSLTVAFGRDADRDGRLSLREQAVELGWDGAWFIRRSGDRAWERRELPGAAGRHRLEASQWLHRARASQRLELAVDGVQLAFGDGTGSWLPLAALDGGTARVTARGLGVEGAAEITARADGAVLKVR